MLQVCHRRLNKKYPPGRMDDLYRRRNSRHPRDKMDGLYPRRRPICLRLRDLPGRLLSDSLPPRARARHPWLEAMRGIAARESGYLRGLNLRGKLTLLRHSLPPPLYGPGLSSQPTNNRSPQRRWLSQRLQHKRQIRPPWIQILRCFLRLGRRLRRYKQNSYS